MAETLLPHGTVTSDAPKLAKQPTMPAVRVPDKQRIDKYIGMISTQAGKVDPRISGCLEFTKPFTTKFIQLMCCCAPFYLWVYKWMYFVYTWLPKQAALAVIGVALCFFGGTYVASIAAIEAFRQFGFSKVQEDLTIVAADFSKVKEANAEDEEASKDKDGEFDANRKVFIFMGAVKNPDRLQNAIGSLWAAYIAVLATLKLEFARTTALALGIVEVVKVPVVRLLSPLVVAALMMAPPDVRLDTESTKGWSVTIIESVLCAIAIIFAWYLQMIISAFYSGIRGGHMFADALIQMLMDWELTKYIPFVAQPFDPDETYLNDLIGYPLAAFGFCFQLFNGFSLPFPFNLVFLPLSIIEWFLRFQISMEGVK